ncbi:hypothetical protein GCM10007082_12550 [Oceanisphaera arctica]|nr:hypothetical protein GCM10007082_12550 [Oceanisphaera arctica]
MAHLDDGFPPFFLYWAVPGLPRVVSFLFTAARQLQICTGFPFMPVGTKAGGIIGKGNLSVYADAAAKFA